MRILNDGTKVITFRENAILGTDYEIYFKDGKITNASRTFYFMDGPSRTENITDRKEIGFWLRHINLDDLICLYNNLTHELDIKEEIKKRLQQRLTLLQEEVEEIKLKMEQIKNAIK